MPGSECAEVAGILAASERTSRFAGTSVGWRLNRAPEQHVQRYKGLNGQRD